MRLWLVLFMGLVFFGPAFLGPANAADFKLEGEATQGGLMIGHAAPGSEVYVGDTPVSLSPDGEFLIGFDRDHPKSALIKVIGPDGSASEQKIEITQRTYNVQRIDGLPTRKVTPNPEDSAEIDANNALIGAVRKLDTPTSSFLSGFAWPVTGPLSGVFGSQRILNGKPKRPHNGVDIAAPENAPVLAAAAGTVALVHQDMFYSGKTVMIDHGLGLNSVYIHMNKITVEEGQIVEIGTQIGTIGMTGRTTGPHLHWGVSLFTKVLDPALLAGKMPQ